MKKIFAIVLGAALMLSGTNAFAQLSVGAGWLNSTETSVYPNNDPTKANLNGFYAGAQYKIPVVAGLSVVPGLYASMLFGKETANGGNTLLSASAEGKYTELALNIPVNVAYTFEIRDFKVFAYLGPILQYGLMSQSVVSASVASSFLGLSVGTGNVTTNNYTGQSKDDNGKTYNGDANRNPFNVYLGGGVGIQAGNFQVIIGYDHSLTNVSKVSNEQLSRSEIKVGVGYAF